MPPLGFRQPHIEVSIDESAGAVHASTCFHTLTIPTFEDIQTMRECIKAVVENGDFNTL